MRQRHGARIININTLSKQIGMRIGCVQFKQVRVKQKRL